MILSNGCVEPPDRIVLGPRGPRPIDPTSEDGGHDLPDGAIACDENSECDDGVECTFDQCLKEGYCRSITDYTRCSDGVFCNGVEICDGLLGCMPADPPTCDDMDPCTIDSCDDGMKQCLHAPRDFDHDGETDVHCPGGTDCDDFDNTRGSALAEICGDIVDNDCDDVVDERNCGKPDHDTCDDALELGQGGTYEVSLRGAVNDYDAVCGVDQVTQDVVFSFELDEARDLRLEAEGKYDDGTDEIANLSLQTQCGSSSSELQCSQGFPANLRVRALPAGRYYVVGSSIQARSLWFSMSTAAATPAPVNRICENAIDVGAGGRFEGDFVDVGDETRSVCGIENQPDVFYKLRLERESDVEISAVSQEIGDLTISVRDGCAQDSMVRGCRSASPALTRLHQMPPGEYIIVLEGPTTREVDYALEVAVLDPTPAPVGDGCERPMQLMAGVPTLVPLLDKQAEVRSSCETTGPDAVFLLTLEEASDVQISVDVENAVAVAALQRTCGDVGTERGCRAGAPLETRLRNVEPGTYYIVVDSSAASSVSVEVQTFPPTPTTTATGNDDCMRATLIPETGGAFSGDTRGLRNDYRAPCGGEAASPDAVFKLVLNAQRRVNARLDTGFDGVLHRIRDQRSTSEVCTNVLPESCSDVTSGGLAELDEVLSPGTYYYVVDGFGDFNSGFYQLDVQLNPP